jgi:hypothetical protein
MIKLTNLLLEQERKRIQGKVKVTYIDSSSVMDVAEILRSIEDVTVVNTAGGDRANNESIYDIKFFTLKEPKNAFLFLKQKAISFPDISNVQIATNSIEFF